MNYEKLTPEKFVTKLKAGEYESLTGARRGIGKADWSDADKEAARTKAEKHFGGVPAPAKKTATKKAPAAKTPAVKAAKAGAKVGRKASAKPDAEPVKTANIPSHIMDPGHYSDILQRAKNVTMADVRKNPHAIVQLAEHGVQSGTNVLNAITALKLQDPSLEISDTVDAAKESVKASLHLMSLVLQTLSSGLEGTTPVRDTNTVEEDHSATANGVNEAAAAVPGTATYEAPTPTE
jgi:hypothetical protein